MANKPILDSRWSQCLQLIAGKVGNERLYKMWFEPIRHVSFDESGRELKLEVPSRFFLDYLDENYGDMIAKVVRSVYGNMVRIVCNLPSVEGDADSSQPAAQKQDPSPTAQPETQQPAAFVSNLNQNLDFDSFVEGDSNKMPLAVARSVAENPHQQSFNPLFIYGHSGVGKTHLANAIGLRCKELYPDMRVLYLPAHVFQVQFVNAQMRDNKVNDFIHFYQSVDMLILDDVQEFQGMKGTLGTFFHIFNHLRMNGKQIVLTSDRSPVELRDMEERMLTRFKWGLQCEIEQPTQSLRYNILKDKIRRDGLVIREDVVQYIAENVSDSVRGLEGIVNSLLAHSLCLGREIDMAMAEQVVRKAVRVEHEPVTIDRIMRAVCDTFEVSVDEMQSATRKAAVAHARQVAMYLAARMTDLSSTRIGMLMGKRSHATVLHSIKQAEALMLKNPRLREQVEDIRGSLLSRV